MSIGLYGGSFDPPNRGHVELARRAKAEFGIERLLVAGPGRGAARDCRDEILHLEGERIGVVGRF